MPYKVPFIRPSFPTAEELSEDYDAIVANNWFTNFGPFERQFAAQTGTYIGSGYNAVTLSSATAGLIAAITAVLGHGNGNKYIVLPSFTFAAGAHAILWCNYQPLFIDIENEGLHMDIDQVKQALEKYDDKVAGILFCNAFGVGTTNIEAWEQLSKKHDKPLIIDSAAGFGSLYKTGRKVGSAGTCEVFSLHATKSFAVGEGGLITTKNTALAKRLNSIQNFGFDANRSTKEIGFNGKLQEINAAIGLRQLKKFQERLDSRRHTFNQYRMQLDPNRYKLQLNAELSALCFASLIVKKGTDRDSILRALQKAGIDAKTYYNPPLHKHPYFANAKKLGPLSVTKIICDSIISLPVHDVMHDDDINLIVDTLNA